MREAFLGRLGEQPGDLTTWLVFADWLDERDDPAGAFIRLSLDLTAGRVVPEETQRRIEEYEKLFAATPEDVREAMARYRSSLPARFRVADILRIGKDPPEEMGGYARTVAVGFLESGEVRIGMDLGLAPLQNGRARPPVMMEVFMKLIRSASAGR